MIQDEINCIAGEVTQEIISAGFGEHMDATKLADCIGRLVLGSFDPSVRDDIADQVREAVEVCLLTHDTKRFCPQVDAETAERLKESLK